ncbi:MAG TPA: aminotransferase class V-fold PLP-dependent enzyme [Candidatus Thermoplasmatota archaeon]|nr:aminotransferase class V-fold PLP-dependent enzyme [Candidatus Thermoplasmatota archaeon]
MDLASAWRDEFPGLARSTYLNTCSLGQLPRRGIAAAEEFQERWMSLGASAWYEIWVEQVETLRRQYASLIGARPTEVAWVPNVSVALSAIASCIDYEDRPDVVLSEMEFPTVAYQWLVRPEAHVRWVQSRDRVRVPVEDYASQITEATAVVAASRVFYTSGYLQDVAALAKAAHAKGALLLVDDYQATGQVPIDVHAADVDVLVGGSLKWLLGGIGSCFLYVRQDLVERMSPRVVGWWGNKHMFDFDATRFAYRPEARRFETGEIGMPSVAYASAGASIVQEIGPATIRRATLALATDLVERAEDAKLVVKSPERPDERTGIVMIELPDPKKAVKHLAQRGIVVDDRPGRLRISPYFYNTVAENERIVDALVSGGFRDAARRA